VEKMIFVRFGRASIAGYIRVKAKNGTVFPVAVPKNKLLINGFRVNAIVSFKSPLFLSGQDKKMLHGRPPVAEALAEALATDH
jgi:hypothetical protein